MFSEGAGRIRGDAAIQYELDENGNYVYNIVKKHYTVEKDGKKKDVVAEEKVRVVVRDECMMLIETNPDPS